MADKEIEKEIDPANPYDLPRIFTRISDGAKVTVDSPVTYNNLLSSGYEDSGPADVAEVADVAPAKAAPKVHEVPFSKGDQAKQADK